MNAVDSPRAPDLARLVGADRVLAVLEELALHPDGVSLDDPTRAMGSPEPTVHRALGALHRDLEAVRERGHAVDDQENEVGIHCLAVPVFGAPPSAPSGGVSISALAHRTPLADLVDAVDEVRGALGTLAGPRR
jgi:DNA-binding IclR family transcriptional regulator